MPRVNFVKKARKAQPRFGISIGDSYFWWKFRFGGKRVSKTYPKQSQLTQSEFLGTIYDIQDRINDIEYDNSGTEVAEIIELLNELGDEQGDKIYNMPESLQSSPTAELLQERCDYCCEMADELEAIELEPDIEDEPEEDDFDEYEEYEEAHSDWEESVESTKQEVLDEIHNISYQGS